MLHARSSYVVSVAHEGGAIVLAVHDHNPRPPVTQPPPDGALSGRGLHLVDQMTRAWGVEAEPGHGKTVWARI